MKLSIWTVFQNSNTRVACFRLSEKSMFFFREIEFTILFPQTKRQYNTQTCQIPRKLVNNNNFTEDCQIHTLISKKSVEKRVCLKCDAQEKTTGHLPIVSDPISKVHKYKL